MEWASSLRSAMATPGAPGMASPVRLSDLHAKQFGARCRKEMTRKAKPLEKDHERISVRKSRDYDFLALRGFDLEPIVRAGPRQVFAACAFCHDAFKALAPGFLEEHRSESLAVAAKGNKPVFGKNGFRALLALDQRHRAQILAGLEHEMDTGRRRMDIALSPPANGPRGSGQD
jgi:hypothetical protein